MKLAALLLGVEDAAVDPPHGVVGCPSCGRIQELPRSAGHGTVHCLRCDHPLERTAGRASAAALACALTTFVLLFPANLLPLLRVSILGVVNRSVIASGVAGIWHQGWPAVAGVVGLEIVVLPFLRFGLLSAVLIAVRAGLRAAWIGPAFRISEALDQWAMMDVFLFGCAVGYSRVAPFLPITIGAGGWCVIAAALLTLVTRASLERRAIWRAIRPDAAFPPATALACASCDLVVANAQAGTRCPRCRARLFGHRPLATMRALAMTLAAFVCYPIAYVYPMEYSERLGVPHGYTIMTGVFKLLDAGLWFFAIVIFVASVMIPLLKLFVLSWCGLSIHAASSRRLRSKTALTRLTREIGRWSHIDVFTVAVFLPLMHLPDYLRVVVGRGLPAFLAVVVLTMIAADLFDSRTLWITDDR
ncbi:MAG: paraquat-inducible protein A [Rhodospirillales bacterium]|nr:paraquat-inducible protein A [Rhodospirillales bacterium]